MNPLLSITIPTFNRASYLRHLLSTLSSQVAEVQPGMVEVFISDNSSTDSTPETIRSFRSSLACLASHRQKSNLGPHRNIAHCVRQARGQYCWILGDDELLQPGALKKLID